MIFCLERFRSFAGVCMRTLHQCHGCYLCQETARRAFHYMMKYLPFKAPGNQTPDTQFRCQPLAVLRRSSSSRKALLALSWVWQARPCSAWHVGRQAVAGAREFLLCGVVNCNPRYFSWLSGSVHSRHSRNLLRQPEEQEAHPGRVPQEV